MAGHSKGRRSGALHCSDVISLSRAIDGFASYVADERRFSPRTVEAYGKDLARFTDFWEQEFANQPAARTPLSKVDTLAVRSYLAHLHRDGLVNRSLARHLSTLRSFFRWACREGHLEKNPARGLPVAAGAESAPARDDASGHGEAPRRRRGRDVRARARAGALRASVRHGPARLGGRGPRSRGRRFRRAPSPRHGQGEPAAHRAVRRRGGRRPARVPSLARRAAPPRRPTPARAGGPSSSTPAAGG